MSEHLSIPGPRNIRPIIFDNVSKGTFIPHDDRIKTYPWLENARYSILKEMWQPSHKNATTGKLTIIIEIHHDN